MSPTVKIRPFANINLCSKCGCPVPRLGVSLRTDFGSVTTKTPFICPKCKSKKKKKR